VPRRSSWKRFRGTPRTSTAARSRSSTRHAVPYYWIVDAERRVVEVYRFAAGGYVVPERFGGDELTDLPPVEGLRLDSTSLWVR
jgi:Uma2 family endonuclease